LAGHPILIPRGGHKPWRSYQQNAGNRCANRRSRRSRPTVDANVMRSIGVQVCVLPSHIPNPPSVNPCSQVTHILGPFALDAQPVFAIMHRSRAALLHIVTDRVSIRCRSVGFTGCDPQGLARQYRRRTAPIVLRTPSPRPPDELAKRLALPATERVNLVSVKQHRGDGHPSRPGSGERAPAHSRPRTARARGDNWGVGTTWPTGSLRQREEDRGTRACPGPDPQPTVAVVRIQGWTRHS
jgi:hypothetical protein